MFVDYVRYPARAALVAAMLGVGQFVQAADAKAKPAVKPDANGLEVVTLTIHPQKLPTPALKYHLLPTFLQQTPGNAVPLYAKAFIGVGDTLRNLARSDKPKSDCDLVDKWLLETPPKDIPRDRAKNLVEAFGMYQVEKAVRRERCDWDPPLRQGRMFEILLPDVQESRYFASMFALKARLCIAEGRYADAIEALQGGYSLARQFAGYRLLVAGLYAEAQVDRMNVQLLTLCQQPGAPNLYWSLTELPHPLVGLEGCLATEYDGLYLQWPELQKVRHAAYAPQQWDLVLRRFVSEVVRYDHRQSSQQEQKAEAAKIVARALDNFARAKADLAAAGYAANQLDTMPPAQIVMLHTVERYDRQRDEWFKWMHLPYWEAEKGIEAAEREIAGTRKHTQKEEIIPVGSWPMHALRNAKLVFARNERELAAFRCIEALRLYLADHDVKLPASLDEVKEVPIPLNPVTGKPFPYHLENATAVLDADGGPTSGPMGRRQTQYRITVAK